MLKFEGMVRDGSREARLLSQLDSQRLPRHIAVIMDGNGRWAGQRHLPRVSGHKAGIDSVREIVESSARLGIEVLTLYAFSTENWKRPRSEVNTLMTLLKEYLQREVSRLNENNIRLLSMGRIDELAPSVQEELEIARRRTAHNTGMKLIIALNYSGRAEMVDAFRDVLRAQPDLRPSDVTEELIQEHLYTRNLPDPDLLIRTSGELRISNFMLWQIAYSEIYVTETLWPDFRREHLFEAILDFQKRERRYGGIVVNQA
ncbi:MAG TPA: isoprenyl transferase [Acidobacteriota bacterium]|nr:isoprenyl transferase [Acidobacteriota bacterium]